MNKKFLIIQLRPEDSTADNEFEAFLKYGGLKGSEVVRIRAEQQGLPKINLDDYSGIIVGGSPYDITTPQSKKPPMQVMLESQWPLLLDEVFEKDFPFLGACSGNGILGNYCGATISKTYGEPVAGVDIQLTEEGKLDPLLKGLPETFRALAGHKEACDDVPPGAVLLASSEICPVHMFRIKSNIYATQFHPEADPAAFELRISVYKNNGYFDPDDADNLMAAIRKENITEPKKILKNFIDRYRS